MGVMSCETVTFRLPSVVKDPAESLPVLFDAYDYCVSFWTRDVPVAMGAFIRFKRGTGFSYECTVAGTTGSRQPSPTSAIGTTFTDGSVTWTCRAADVNGISPISSPQALSDPTGLTITSVAAQNSREIIATYSGGELDQDYDAVFTFILNGLQRVARQRVEVRKQ